MYRQPILVGSLLFFVSCALIGGFTFYKGRFGASPTSVDEMVFDFGVKPIDDSFEHVFLLRNYSNSVLDIIDVRSSCSCVKVEWLEKAIKPTSAVPIKVKVSLKNLRGPVEQHIVVELNDPFRRFLLLKTKGIVLSAFSVSPTSVNFGKTTAEQELEEKVVTIGIRSAVAYNLQSVSCDSPFIQLKQETVEEGKSYRIHVRPTGS